MATGTAFEILRESAPTFSVGIISADLMNLGSEAELLEKAGIKALHFDVMDGCFVPGLTAGPPFIKGIRTGLLKDVHLLIDLIDNSADRIADYVAAGADALTDLIDRTLKGKIRPL